MEFLDKAKTYLPILHGLKEGYYKSTLTRLVLLIIFVIICVYLMSLAGTVAWRRYPKNIPDQPDLGFDIIPFLPRLNNWAGYFIVLSAFSIAIRCLFHKEGLIMMRRGLFIYGFCVFLRATTSATTSYHDPSLDCETYGPPTTPWEFFMVTILPKDGVTCGDMMFSGHTIMYITTAMLWSWYCPVWQSFFAWLVSLSGMFFLIAFRLHYTDDVLVAIYITMMMFFFYHSLIDHKNPTSKFFRLIVFLEADRIAIEEEEAQCRRINDIE